MNIIDRRDDRTKQRKKSKDTFDAMFTLSSSPEDGTVKLAAKKEDDRIRLLDEGMVVLSNGAPDFYIKKGTVTKYIEGKNRLLMRGGDLMNLTDDYVGSVNIGHIDFASFPCGIVGEWTKNDLSTETDENGRTSLFVKPVFNEEHPLMQALRVQGIPVGVSVEMYTHTDEALSREMGIAVVDEVFISDFAIVGECGNVNSSETIKESAMKDPEKKEESAEVKETAEVTEVTEVTEETAEVNESDAEESGDVEESETEEDYEAVLEAVNSYKEQIDKLTEQVKALKKDNKRLSGKLKAELDKRKNFVSKFPKLSIDMGLQEEEKEDEKPEQRLSLYSSDDGI